MPIIKKTALEENTIATDVLNTVKVITVKKYDNPDEEGYSVIYLTELNVNGTYFAYNNLTDLFANVMNRTTISCLASFNDADVLNQWLSGSLMNDSEISELLAEAEVRVDSIKNNTMEDGEEFSREDGYCDYIEVDSAGVDLDYQVKPSIIEDDGFDVLAFIVEDGCRNTNNFWRIM